MRTVLLLLSIIPLLFCVSFLQADIIHVPGGKPTIQAGIDAAVDGDTVLVADGIYTGDGNRDIDFLGKAIVVMSENGEESCVIDCEADSLDPHRGFYFHTGEDSTSMVKGFTIRNGNAYGLYPNSRGGAIVCDSSSPLIVGNTLTGNTAYLGGGIWVEWYSSPIILRNTISRNTSYMGGGIYCNYSGFPTIKENKILNNSADLHGGGIFCEDLNLIIKGNYIFGNMAREGAGIYSSISAGVILDGNIITGNVAEQWGGGIYCFMSNNWIKNNTVTWNEAGFKGGAAVFTMSSSSILTDNTIIGNTASQGGGGLHCDDFHTSVNIANTIIWYNSPEEIDGEPLISYSNIKGGWTGEGNIDADPMFVLADKNDYRLLWESPCIDTGHPDSLDADGTRSDMGAFYFDQDDYLTLYVTPDTTEVEPGDQLGVTYTAINRWEQPEPFWHLTQVITPGRDTLNVLGPERYTLPARNNNCDQCHQWRGYTARIHKVHYIPLSALSGLYKYRSVMGVPPSTLYDWDSFKFKVIK